MKKLLIGFAFLNFVTYAFGSNSIESSVLGINNDDTISVEVRMCHEAFESGGEVLVAGMGDGDREAARMLVVDSEKCVLFKDSRDVDINGVKNYNVTVSDDIELEFGVGFYNL